MLEGVGNFRDIGGQRTIAGDTVRTGWIYRAAHFAHATDTDPRCRAADVRFVTSAAPATSADGHTECRPLALVRTMFDLQARPTSGLRTQAPRLSRDGLGLVARTTPCCLRLARVTQPDRPPLLADVAFAHRRRYASVIHCSPPGRTGWGATLILLLLGVYEAKSASTPREQPHRANRLRWSPRPLRHRAPSSVLECCAVRASALDQFTPRRGVEHTSATAGIDQSLSHCSASDAGVITVLPLTSRRTSAPW